MSHASKTANTRPPLIASVAVGLLATAALFMLLAINLKPKTPETTVAPIKENLLSASTMPPPPPKAPEQTQTEQSAQLPETMRQEPKLNLEQLQVALNPGIGQAGAMDFSFGNFGIAAGELNAINIFEVDAVDQIPRPIKRVSPSFPHTLNRPGFSGEVVLQFVVNTQGRVESVEVERATHHALRDPAIRALKRWTFEPGRQNDQPVKVRMRIPFVFSSDA